jgi:predicted membrane protein
MKFGDKDLPGLFQSADLASIKEQRKFFSGIFWYLTLLIVAAIFAFFADDYPNPIFKIISTILFLLTLFIMIWLRVSRPDYIWYNGRAVAESVKTRSWRWMMRAEPYIDCDNIEIVRKHFVNDLKTILKQNESLIGKLGISASIEEPISEKMIEIRKLNLSDRFNFYRQERITEQAIWYTNKSKFNKKRAEMWFWTTVSLHALAILYLLYNIYYPTAKLTIVVLAVAASSVLTWLQAKKHNELSSSYSLTAHEIILIKSEVNRIEIEEDFSEYIINCENAFSREHTQWFARKNE